MGLDQHFSLRRKFPAPLSYVLFISLFAAILPLWANSALANQPVEDSLLIESIISRLQAGETIQRQKLHDVTLSGTMYERRLKGNGEIKEEKRFDHITYMRRKSDTVRKMDIHEDYLRYFKNGKIQKAKELAKEVENRLKKKKKSGSYNISAQLSDAFSDKHRQAYRYMYGGITDTLVEERICHIVEVSANPERRDKKEKTRIEGIYYIDTLSCRITRVDFRPAKLGGGLVFKVNEVNMTLTYYQVSEHIWLPNYFHITGKGKAALFFTIRFESEGTFQHPIINSGLPDSLFLEPISVGTP